MLLHASNLKLFILFRLIYTKIHQLCYDKRTLNLLGPEKLKPMYSFVDSATNVDCNKEMNEHDDASDICRYF